MLETIAATCRAVACAASLRAVDVAASQERHADGPLSLLP